MHKRARRQEWLHSLVTVHSPQPLVSTPSAKLLSLTRFLTYSVTSLTLHNMLEQQRGRSGHNLFVSTLLIPGRMLSCPQV